MNVWDLLARLDRAQKTRRFKIIGSFVWIGLMALIFGGGAVVLTAPPAAGALEAAQEAAGSGPATASIRQEALEAAAQAGANTPLAVLIGVAGGVVTLFGLAAIWIGLALSYVGLALLGVAVFFPLTRFEPTEAVGTIGVLLIPLIFLFLTLLQLARLALAGPFTPIAIARNVLNEAVRMKISMVFIVILLLLLALIPEALNPDQPLRFRVQIWMQYGVGFGFLVLALLTVFFSCGSVAFEQRDKIIWQTMSKPVPPWGYVLGKWIGVMVLNAVLLSVVAGGVFMFTQYLRFQPAQGEIAYRINADGADSRADTSLMTEDRRKLESEVLVARQSIEPDPPEIDAESIENVVQREIEDRKRRDPSYRPTQADRAEIRNQIAQAIAVRTRSAPLGGAAVFTFDGLNRDVLTGGKELTLRFAVHAGSNDPAAIYRLFFRINGVPWPPETQGMRSVALKNSQVFNIPARAMLDNGEIVDLVTPEGEMFIEVLNDRRNRQQITFPPGEVELLYPAGGYELNFSRVMVVLWVKLAFVAAVAIAASTFLSFPVACLVSLGVFFAAETADFLRSSLEVFDGKNIEGETVWAMEAVRWISIPVAWIFQTYADLTPIEKLTDGRLLSWSEFGEATAVIAVWSIIVLAVGVAIFRSRELAMYSGK